MFKERFKVGFWDDLDAVKAVENDIDDFLYDNVIEDHGIDLDRDQMDAFLANILKIAKERTQ